MGISRLLLAMFIGTFLSLPVLAEPAWWASLSHQKADISYPADQRVGHISGTDKHQPYNERYRQRDQPVDTEIAAFEEVRGDSGYKRAARLDRVPHF